MSSQKRNHSQRLTAAAPCSGPLQRRCDSFGHGSPVVSILVSLVISMAPMMMRLSFQQLGPDLPTSNQTIVRILTRHCLWPAWARRKWAAGATVNRRSVGRLRPAWPRWPEGRAGHGRRDRNRNVMARVRNQAAVLGLLGGVVGAGARDAVVQRGRRGRVVVVRNQAIVQK